MHFSFKVSTKLLIWPLLTFLLSLIDLFYLFNLTIPFFICIDIALDFILIAQVKQLPNANSTPEINFKAFIWLICLELTREQTICFHEAACWPKYFGCFWPRHFNVLCTGTHIAKIIFHNWGFLVSFCSLSLTVL